MVLSHKKRNTVVAYSKHLWGCGSEMKEIFLVSIPKCKGNRALMITSPSAVMLRRNFWSANEFPALNAIPSCSNIIQNWCKINGDMKFIKAIINGCLENIMMASIFSGFQRNSFVKLWPAVMSSVNKTKSVSMTCSAYACYDRTFFLWGVTSLSKPHSVDQSQGGKQA